MRAKKSKPEVEGIYPLSFLQQALLFHSLQETNDQGFLQVRCTLNGAIDLEAFQKAWQQTIQRHESLRTSIHWENLEKSVQVVHKKAKLPFTFSDWTKYSPSKQAEKLEGLINLDETEKLELSKAPVLRIKLIKLGTNEYFLLWSCHHILADGWSASIILEDLFTFYDSNQKQIEATFPTIPSYKSYLEWIKKQDIRKARSFWAEFLDRFESPTIVGKPHSQTQKNRELFKVESYSFSEETSGELREFAKKNQVTVNTFFLGVWSLLLSRFTNELDIVTGTIVSGRSIDLPNAERMAGMYMNILPIRTKIESATSIKDWLKSLQICHSKVRNYEYLNLDEILAQTNSAADSKLFDNLIVFENMPLENVSGGGVTVEGFESGLTSNYALTLAVKPTREIEFHLKYDTSQVSENAVGWFVRKFPEVIDYLLEDNLKTLDDVLRFIGEYSLSGNQFESAAEDGVDSAEYVAPGNEIEIELTAIFETLLNRQSISVTDDFFELGGTSIIAIRLFTQIEQRFRRKFQPILLLQNRTIKALAKLVKSEDSGQQFLSLVPLRASGSKPPIFCLHAGGGHVFFYKDLARHLGKDQPVYALQRLGLDDVTQAAEAIETMASHYFEEIRKVQPEGPYSLLAYCFSTSICWEIVKLVKERGETVSLIAMVDSPPYYQDKRTTDEKVTRVLGKLKNFDMSFIRTIWRGRILHPIRQKWGYFLGGKTEQQEQKLKAVLNVTAKSYNWEPLPVKITLLRSDSMSKLPEQNEAVKEWNELALKGVETFFVGGQHDLLFEEPNVKNLADQIEACLDNVVETSG